jgi:hypothetical protein
MRVLVLSSLVIITLFSTEMAWAQENLPSNTSLTVQILQTYSYKADDGTTVVLGEVQNNNFFPITNVKVGVLFLDQNDNTIEYKTGTTLLLVVPPNGKAPFSISSTKADPTITQVSVKMAGFVSASSRDQVLAISPGVLKISDKTTLSGTIKNNGNDTSVNTRLYLLTYDAFQRVVAIGTTTTPDIGGGNTVNFNITSTSSYRAKSYEIVAESDHYQSKLTDVTNILASLPVMISNTAVTDPNGTQFSTIPVGATVKINSNLNYIGGNSMQPYVYYVQVKQFGGQTAFIGKYQGVFLNREDSPSVTWTPDTAGSYYIETFVWNSDNVPLSSAGTRINVVLVQS